MIFCYNQKTSYDMRIRYWISYVCSSDLHAGPSSPLLSTSTLMAASRAGSTAVPVTDQVVLRIQKAVAEGRDRISMSLKPADMGRVDVKLDVGPNGRVQAVLRSEERGGGKAGVSTGSSRWAPYPKKKKREG